MAVRIGALADSSMIATRVGSVRRVVCGNPAYFAAHATPKTPDDLADLPCVTFAGLASGTSWTFASRGRGGTQTVPVNCRLNVNTAEAAIDAAIAGIGATQVLSYQVARAVEERKLRIVLKEFEFDPMPVSLIHAGQGLLPLKMRRFLEFAVPRLRKALK
jgi:DNA-binding transcriptional LysR family regulator